jgi:uncharacterized protein (TIGR02118 family)
MIHQLIFAAPKPEMTEKEFQDYWINVHAVQYASKITQIKQYCVDARIPVAGENGEPLWSGIAEIWLENEEEQLASMQSKEFIDGARMDEPRWAAYWRTVGLDTDAHVIVDGGGLKPDASWVKVVGLIKRKWGMPLDEFRNYSLTTHAELDKKLPCLRRYVQFHARDGLYTVGEPMFDAAVMFWFDNMDALKAMQESSENQVAAADLQNFIEMKYAHVMVTDEHWVIGPHGYD